MEDKRVKLESGLEIFYLEAGDKSNPTVILLHGYPTNSQLWREVIPRLEKEFHVIAPDLPGHGFSNKPTNIDYSLNFFVAFLEDFLNKLELEKINLVAHDLGGMLGLGFVARNQEKINRFVIMNTAPYIEWPTLNRILIFAFKNPVISKLFLTNWGFVSLMRYAGLKNAEETIKRYLDCWRGSKDERKAFRLVVSASAKDVTEPLESLRSINVPTMILWGDRDNVFPFEIAEQLHGDIKNSILVKAKNCGHFVPEHSPGFVARNIIDFFKERDSE